MRKGFWTELFSDKKETSHFYWTIPDPNDDGPGTENEQVAIKEDRLAWNNARIEFSEADTKIVEKWQFQVTLEIERWENPNSVRRRTRLILISVLFLCSQFGMMPSELPIVNFKITASIRETIIFLLFGAQILSYWSYAFSIRDFLIRKKIYSSINIENDKFPSDNNRIKKYVDVLLKERSFVYSTIPKYITVFLCATYAISKVVQFVKFLYELW